MENEVFQLPERSKFYNLEPIGVGTIEAESFSGYISRLAQEHFVTPVILIKNSVDRPEQLPQVFAQDSIPAKAGANLNGFSETSEKLVEIFRKATFREDIQHMTLTAWKDRISSHGLLKKHLAWCSVCFQEQLTTNEIVYEKLIWTFEAVTICPIHQIELSEVCRHCRSKLNVLSGRSRPGFCSKCLRWLGLKTVLKTIPEDSKEFWTAQNAGNLLLINSQIKNSFSLNLQNLIQRTANGNINDFAHLTGVWHLAIRRLIRETVSPTLGMLIEICYSLKIPITNLFTGHIEFSISKNSSYFPSGNVLTKEEVKPKLIEYCDENPPPSANKVARRIGWQTTRFQRNFPFEYEKIVERYLQYQAGKLPDYSDEQIEEILTNAINESPSPSLQSVFRRIGCRSTGYRYYSRFPELCEQISNRYKQANKKEFDLEKAGQTLNFALKEEPIPSFSEVARRLKCSRTTLNNKFPELSAELHKKYKIALKTIRAKNKREMYEEIVETISELQARQKSVTENAVRKLLKRKWNDKNFKKAYKEIRLRDSG